MPDNPSPAAQPDSGPAPAELNFDQPPSENPRIKRRSLKAKAPGLKTAAAPPAARDGEREVPPSPAGTAAKAPAAPKTEPKPANIANEQQPPVKTAPVAPARSKPTISLTSTSARPPEPAKPATQPAASGGATKPAPAPTSTSPHGTRPATLYYSSYPRKEIPSSMKPHSPASPAPASIPSSTSTSAAATQAPRPAPTSSYAAARPATAVPAATAPRTNAAPIDYRANVDRQTREQKSVGSLLSYIVYGLILVFVAGAALAGYGGKIIFDKLHDQSATLSDLDATYGRKNAELSGRLNATQDTLAQAQAAISRQQELITKQQEDINRLLAQITDSSNATKTEAKARAQETAALRNRVRDLENKSSLKY